MRNFLLAIFVLLFPLGANAQGRFDEIIRAELAFDAKTKATNFAEGFLAFADENAVWFNPGPKKAFEELSEMATKPESKTPNTLRWFPHFMGLAKSGDFGFDLGLWYKEDSDKVGQFFTIWQKDENGKWLYTLDVGAGTLKNKAQLPPDKDYSYLSKSNAAPKGNIFDFDETLNNQLSQNSAPIAYEKYLNSQTIILSEDEIGSNFGGDKIALINTRPNGDWQFSGVQMAKSRDLIATFGNVAKDDVVLGYYIRLWQWQGAKYQLLIDIYRPQKPAQ